MKKVSISVSLIQKEYGDKEAIRIAKQIGADAVDFGLERFDIRNSESIYSKSEDEITAYFKKIKDIIPYYLHSLYLERL